jgi:hypothetical protein
MAKSCRFDFRDDDKPKKRSNSKPSKSSKLIPIEKDAQEFFYKGVRIVVRPQDAL